MRRSTRAELIPADLPILQSIAREYGHTEPAHADQVPDPYKRPMAQVQWLDAASLLKNNTARCERLRFGFLARGIREGLLWSDEVMDRYCAATCPSCQDPCCSANGIYFDRGDLLYLIGLEADLPMSQTRELAGAHCRYLSATGCILPRMCRPFICTWFLCEPQMALLQAEPLPFQKRFTAIMQAVRRCRLQLMAIDAKGPTGQAV